MWNKLSNMMVMNGMGSTVAATLPAQTTVAAVSTAGLVGAAVGGETGLVLGVLGSSALSMVANRVINKISVGVGKVYEGIQHTAHAIEKRVKHNIYCALDTLVGWLARWSDSSDWSKSAYAQANKAYLQQMDKLGMSLSPLLQPIPNGVAAQTTILKALYVQALKAEQPVTEKNIREWVALGERIVAALADSEQNMVGDGTGVTVSYAEEKTPILVESSLYTIRAVAWYINAQALWHASLQQETLPQAERARDEGRLRTLAENMTASSTFVLPDEHGRLFTFIQHAKPCHTSSGHLLNSQSNMIQVQDSGFDPSNAMNLPALNDSSRHLPGNTRRLIANPLTGIAGGPQQRLAIQLQALASPAVTGQYREGHEPLAWQALQMATAFSTQVMTAIDDWNATPVIRQQTLKEQQHHAIYQELGRLLDNVYYHNKDKSERNDTYARLKNMPLLSLLQLLHEDKPQTKAQEELSNRLGRIDIAGYNALTTQIAKVVKEEAQGSLAEERVRVGDEILVPTHLKTEAELKKYINKNTQEIGVQLDAYTKPRLALSEQIVCRAMDLGAVAGGLAMAAGTRGIQAGVGAVSASVNKLASVGQGVWSRLWGAG